jgi:GIY-YIG catalytic domain
LAKRSLAKQLSQSITHFGGTPWFLYVLALQHNKFYVGKSQNLEERIKDHKNGRGTAWTKRYQPIEVLVQRPLSNQHEENNVTLDYMDRYGMDNVRGGSWCRMKLTDTDRTYIRQMIDSIYDRCYICHQSGHSASSCPLRLTEMTTPPSLPNGPEKLIYNASTEKIRIQIITHIRSINHLGSQWEKTFNSGKTLSCSDIHTNYSTTLRFSI